MTGLVLGLAADLRVSGVSATGVSAGTGVAMLSATAALVVLDCPRKMSVRRLVQWRVEPGEVAATIRWLCSQQSCALTGSVLHTAGGGTT